MCRYPMYRQLIEEETTIRHNQFYKKSPERKMWTPTDCKREEEREEARRREREKDTR